jgi:hypothetical protein
MIPRRDRFSGPGNLAVLSAFVPISGIGVVLVYMGLAGRVVEIMGGLRNESVSSPPAEAVEAVTFLSCTFLVALPVILILYGVAIGRHRGWMDPDLEKYRYDPTGPDVADEDGGVE